MRGSHTSMCLNLIILSLAKKKYMGGKSKMRCMVGGVVINFIIYISIGAKEVKMPPQKIDFFSTMAV